MITQEKAPGGRRAARGLGVRLGGPEHRQDRRSGPSPQAVAALIEAAREAARDALVRGLSSEGADAFAALSLGRHHARRAERLALFAEVRP